MILRGLASLVLFGLLGLNFALPTSSMTHRGNEDKIRSDVTSELLVGQSLPPLGLVDYSGQPVTREDLLGDRVLVTFERSVDW